MDSEAVMDRKIEDEIGLNLLSLEQASSILGSIYIDWGIRNIFDRRLVSTIVYNKSFSNFTM